MGADEKSNLEKCGEILINIKAKNKKTKIYTFNCSFCNANYDQLKKFSMHLEQKHFQKFGEESSKQVEIFEPEIKLEEHLEVGTTNVFKNTTITSQPIEVHEDPLETNEIVDKEANTEESVDVKIKVEDELHCDDSNKDYYNFNNEEMDFEDCVEDNDYDYKPRKKKIKKIYQPKKTCNRSSDASSHDSNDDNFRIKDQKTKGRLKRRRNKKSETDLDVEDKELIKALFQSFEKHKNLWNIQERTHDKNTLQKGFETIASEVNEKLNTNITWHLAKIRINAMRIEYSYELEKQRKGEDHQIPWYFEHMKYLQENIDYMIKERHRRFDRRLKNLDQSIVPILIELYKKYNDLWQVHNICFGVTAKRDEAFKKIIDDLKQSHNLDMTTDILQDYIKYINRLYSKDKELQLKCELEKSEFIPTFHYYKEMSFLNESQGPFKCAICNEIIRKYENYHIHVADHHNTRPFKCPLCETDFKTFDTYLVHAKRHLNLNSFDCNICGKVYPFKNELDRHLIGHTGEKPFLCQICGSSFRVYREYDNHVRRHEKRFRYECHICKHGFNQLHTLNDHVKSHLNIRDIFCDICGKGFTASRYLNNHKLIHEDKKRYKCNVCGKEFAQGAGFRAHRKQHQPHLTAAEIRRKKESLLNSFDA